MRFKNFCRECGEIFYADAEWKSVCIHCYKGEKRTRALLAEANIEIARLRLLIEKQLLPARRIQQLIQLCHPDKHDGSRAATEITQWLLSLRKF